MWLDVMIMDLYNKIVYFLGRSTTQPIDVKDSGESWGRCLLCGKPHVCWSQFLDNWLVVSIMFYFP